MPWSRGSPPWTRRSRRCSPGRSARRPSRPVDSATRSGNSLPQTRDHADALRLDLHRQARTASPCARPTAPEHLAYLQSLGDALKLAGPFTEADGETMNGSLIVVEASSLEAARGDRRRRSLRQSGAVRLGRDPPVDVDHQQPGRCRRGRVSAGRDDLLAVQIRARRLVLGRSRRRKAPRAASGTACATTRRATNHARDEEGRSRLSSIIQARRERIVGVVKVVAEAHPELDRWNRHLGVRRRGGSDRRAEAGDARRDQGEHRRSRTWCWSRIRGSRCSPCPREEWSIISRLAGLKEKSRS